MVQKTYLDTDVKQWEAVRTVLELMRVPPQKGSVLPFNTNAA